MNDTPDRAEMAFRDALAAHDDPDLVPLDPAVLRAAASQAAGGRRTRRAWLPLAAAAALVAGAGCGTARSGSAAGCGLGGWPAARPVSVWKGRFGAAGVAGAAPDG